ncbi:MAG: LysR family transcriptional regulator, partial [Pseudomonadota bacterium]
MRRPVGDRWKPRALGVSQPTVGRHIEGLERALGTELFERHARGFHLSPTGRR